MKQLKKLFLFTIMLSVFSLCAHCAEFTKSNTYNNTFSDIDENAWYAKGVCDVFELSLMNGVSDTEFAPLSNLSVSEGITVAARLNSIYNDTDIPEVENAEKWYTKYIQYCIEKDIMSQQQFESFDRSIMAFELVQLLANALPKSFYPSTNDISYIQDIPENLYFADDIFLFYNAGILCGNDDFGTFLPTSSVTRMRAATIFSRVALVENRMTFSLLPKPDSYTLKQALDILDYQTTSTTLDEITVISNNDYIASAAEYRYLLKSYNDDTSKTLSALKTLTATSKISQDLNVTIPYEVVSGILVDYYYTRLYDYGQGLTYYDVLESQYLSDKVYTKHLVMQNLIPLIISKRFEITTPDEVYKFALENDYICAKHILITAETENAFGVAKDVHDRLREGHDFDVLLKEYGMDPGMEARPTGYYFTKGQMVEEFENVAFSLNDSATSDVVKSPYGYHIIKRYALDKQELANSLDYHSICANATVYLYNIQQKQVQDATVFEYIENFDNIVNLLK